MIKALRWSIGANLVLLVALGFCLHVIFSPVEPLTSPDVLTSTLQQENDSLSRSNKALAAEVDQLQGEILDLQALDQARDTIYLKRQHEISEIPDSAKLDSVHAVLRRYARSRGSINP